jgi:tetratricopeptide (TPR) repeat protein
MMNDVPRSGFLLPLFCVLSVSLVIGFIACSSAPKRPEEIHTVRYAAETQLELANQAADRGYYSQALDLLAEARRLAVNVDDPPLRIRTGLSLGNILFFLGRRDEADEAWQAALVEADQAGNGELAAICRIYQARGELLAIIAGDGAGGGTGGDAADIRNRVQRELGAVKTDKLAAALGWTVIGLAEKELGRYKEAESALKKALDIHDSERYLEQAAYDWYLIASVRSVAGSYETALAALREAIILDRRSENSHGLGKDWLAMGDVYTKAGKGSEAAAAYGRAAAIFRSEGFEVDAEAAERR